MKKPKKSNYQPPIPKSTTPKPEKGVTPASWLPLYRTPGTLQYLKYGRRNLCYDIAALPTREQGLAYLEYLDTIERQKPDWTDPVNPYRLALRYRKEAACNG